MASSDLEIFDKSAAMSANAPRAADGTFAKTSLCESASTSPIPRFLAVSAILKNIFAAVFSPTFGRNLANRMKDTESLGFAANFSWATTSLTWACSKNFKPLVMANGIERCWSCSCMSIA